MDFQPNRLEASDKAIRFGCGAIFGAIGSFYFLRRWVFRGNGVTILDIAICSIACGVAALRYGDKFWASIRHD